MVSAETRMPIAAQDVSRLLVLATPTLTHLSLRMQPVAQLMAQHAPMVALGTVVLSMATAETRWLIAEQDASPDLGPALPATTRPLLVMRRVAEAMAQPAQVARLEVVARNMAIVGVRKHIVGRDANLGSGRATPLHRLHHLRHRYQ